MQDVSKCCMCELTACSIPDLCHLSLFYDYNFMQYVRICLYTACDFVTLITLSEFEGLRCSSTSACLTAEIGDKVITRHIWNVTPYSSNMRHGHSSSYLKCDTAHGCGRFLRDLCKFNQYHCCRLLLSCPIDYNDSWRDKLKACSYRKAKFSLKSLSNLMKTIYEKGI